jgi:hypothetical protein
MILFLLQLDFPADLNCTHAIRAIVTILLMVEGDLDVLIQLRVYTGDEPQPYETDYRK